MNKRHCDKCGDKGFVIRYIGHPGRVAKFRCECQDRDGAAQESSATGNGRSECCTSS